MELQRVDKGAELPGVVDVELFKRILQILSGSLRAKGILILLLFFLLLSSLLLLPPPLPSPSSSPPLTGFIAPMAQIEAYFILKPVQQLFYNFAYTCEFQVQLEINFLGDAIYKAQKGKASKNRTEKKLGNSCFTRY